MRYLLLSVLVACVIGIMVPSVFASHGTDEQLGTIRAMPSVLELPYTARDNSSSETITIAGTVTYPGQEKWVYVTIIEPDGKTSKEYNAIYRPTIAGVGPNHHWSVPVQICCNNIGTYLMSAEYEGHLLATGTFTVVEKGTYQKPTSSTIQEEIPTFTTEPVAEPEPVTYATLPPGVKSPAPNFERVFENNSRFSNLKGLTISELYAHWDYEWNNGFIKIVSGDGKDLLVWHVTLDCSGCDESREFSYHKFRMYDGEDRKFTPVTSYIYGGLQGVVENPNFSWSEDCSPLPVTVQPGVIDEMKVCFEIPKDSDHFKIVDMTYDTWRDISALFDRSTISNAASSQTTKTLQLQEKSGGCLIATATFGSEMAPQVQFLREIRDNTVLQTESGTSFMTGFNQFYYSFSPAVADYERENPAFKEAVKITLTPLLASLTLLQYADIDSESEMLGYGIGVILLNIGMYFVAPAVLLSVCIRKIHQKQS